MSRPRSGFTLTEMLTTVAALVIVLGLMVSLARFVRNRSARELTQHVMVELEDLMTQYEHRYRALPPVPPLVSNPSAPRDEQVFHKAALENNRAMVAALRRSGNRAMLSFNGLPFAIYDEVNLRDAWGSPIVFMFPGAGNIGMSPQARFFFLSAGPDRRFSTLEDNLYSYESAEMRK